MTFSERAVEAAATAMMQRRRDTIEGRAEHATYTELAKAALTAALAVDGLALVWSDPAKPNDYCSYDHCYADTPFGRYQIEWKSWKSDPGYFAEGAGLISVCGSSLDDTKRAVESAIINCIRAMLTAASDGEVG